MNNLEVCIKPFDFIELEDIVTTANETIADIPNVIRVSFRCKNGYTFVYNTPVFYSPTGLQVKDSQTQLGVTIGIPAASVMSWLPALLNKLRDILTPKFGCFDFNYTLMNDLFMLPVELNAAVFDRITQVPLQYVKNCLLAQSQLAGPGYYMVRIFLPSFKYSGQSAVLQMQATQLLYQPMGTNVLNDVKLLLPLDQFPSPSSSSNDSDTFILRPEMQIPPLEALNLPKPKPGFKAPTSSPVKSKSRRRRVTIKPMPPPSESLLSSPSTTTTTSTFSQDEEEEAAIESFLEDFYSKNKS